MRLYRHSRKQRRDRASPKHYRENTAHKAKTGKKRVVITAAFASAVAFGFGIIGYALLHNGVTSSVNAVKTANYAQDYSINGGTFTWSDSVTMGSSAEVEFSDSQAGTYTLTISPPAKSSTQADKGYCVITVTDNCDDTPETIVTPSVASGSTQTFTLDVKSAGKLKFEPHWGEPANYSQTPNISNGGTIVVGESQQPVTANRFTHSDNLANVDTYLYRVGNGNTVTLGTLFKVETRAAVVSDNVSVTFENTAGNAAMPTYSKNSSDWTQSTVKFTGEGVGGVTIKEGNGTPYTLNLEIVTANNFIENATVNGNANIVLLGNVKLGGSSGTNPALSLNGKKLFGNGFQIDATGSNISTKGHGLISLTNAMIDNAQIKGPTFTTYQGDYNNDYYASTVLCDGGDSVVSNCRITGASSPLRTKSNAVISNTVLSGGLFANLYLMGGKVTVEDVTTVNTQNSLAIATATDTPSSASITIDGSLTQHNFIADNATMNNDYAKALKNAMFGSSYSKYQFTSGSRKYVNTGILSMSPSFGAANIVDNRSDKKNYSGMNASIMGQQGYVYTMENTDPNMLETSYTEPAYSSSKQIPYDPVFSWAVPSGDNVPAGGEAHCFKDSSGVLQIQFLTGSSKTLDLSSLPTFKKYQTISYTPDSITCAKKASGANVAVNNGSATFTEAGEYIISYSYNGVPVYDKDLNTPTSVNYTKTVLVNVAVKKVAPNAVITVSQINGTMIWGSAGWAGDRDYQPAAQIFDYMTITDYDNDGTAYTVLDGNNQAAFLNSIASVVADSDNKTGFTINFPDGTKLVIKCGAPYNSGTLEFKKYNNKFLMCGSKAYNNPTAATWNVTSYTYTGRNGVAVTYGKRGFTSTTDSTTCSLKSLGTNNFLMYDAQGGTVSPTYTSTSPATLPTPTREGYTFLNWNTKADGTGTKRNAGTSYSFSSSTTLYAIWAKNVTVSFSSEGAIISTISAGAGSTMTLPVQTMTSSWLEGWYTEESGGTKVGNGGASFTVPSSDTTYYAHWSPKYAVTYNANGGMVDVEEAVYEGTALTLPTPTNGVKTCEGWFTAAEDGTLVGTGGDSYTPTADIELFAHWSDNILVTFNGNGGTAGTNSATYDNVNPITLPTATWAGHQFNGWYTAANGGTKVGDADASYIPTEPVTLHAQWTAYTVSFDGNGVTNPSSLPAGANGTVTLPTLTRTGYTFNGWYTAASGGTKVGNGGASYTPTANITLHAQWTVNSYKVTISTSNSSTAVTVNGTTVTNGGSVAYNSVVKVVLSYTQSNSLTFTIKQGNSNVTYYSNEACTSSTTSTAAGTYYFKMPAGDVTINSSSKESGGGTCVVYGTMVTMADGTHKPVEQIIPGDELLVWNLETGKYDSAPVVFNEHEPVKEYDVIHVCFSDGTTVDVVEVHGFFDLNLGEYVYITAETKDDYIGHKFVKSKSVQDNTWETVTLERVWVEKQTLACCEPAVYKHLCFYTNDILSMAGGISGLFNIFDVDTETMTYDSVKMQADIEKYGLFTYEDFEGIIPESAYYAFNGAWLKVAIGKGNLTWEYIEYLAERYARFF